MNNLKTLSAEEQAQKVKRDTKKQSSRTPVKALLKKGPLQRIFLGKAILEKSAFLETDS